MQCFWTPQVNFGDACKNVTFDQLSMIYICLLGFSRDPVKNRFWLQSCLSFVTWTAPSSNQVRCMVSQCAQLSCTRWPISFFECFLQKLQLIFCCLSRKLKAYREKQPLSFRSDDGQEGIIFKQKLSWVIWSYLIGKCAKGIAQGADSPYNELDTV